jgi:hypothetical protein
VFDEMSERNVQDQDYAIETKKIDIFFFTVIPVELSYERREKENRFC